MVTTVVVPVGGTSKKRQRGPIRFPAIAIVQSFHPSDRLRIPSTGMLAKRYESRENRLQLTHMFHVRNTVYAWLTDTRDISKYRSDLSGSRDSALRNVFGSLEVSYSSFTPIEKRARKDRFQFYL